MLSISIFLESEVKENILGWVWTSYHKVIGIVLHIILSPAPSTVTSIPGTQKVFVELFSNFSCLSQGNLSCPQAAASRSAPRNNIYSKDHCAVILGKHFPSLLRLFLLP